MSRFLRCCCLLIALATANSGCKRQSDKAKPASPAKVEMVPHESELATITLTPEAESRLGIATALAESKLVQQHRVFGGEIVVPSGKSIVVSAPVPSTVKSRGTAGLLPPGTKVKAGDVVLELAPILSPERDVPTPAEKVQMVGAKATLVAAQVAAQGDVQRGEADVKATKIALERAQKLLADRAGSQRAVDDAQALANVAQTTLAAAQNRFDQLSKMLATLENKGQLEPASDLKMNAPVDGVIRSLSVSAGQQVIGGAPLFEVLDTSIVWVRVPVFVELLDSIQPGADGRIVSLNGNDKQNDAPVLVRSIDAPPTADAISSSVDLYFEAANAQSQFRPGQRVGIDLPLHTKVEGTVVAASSILYDVYGGTWVYVVSGSHRYQRHRVVVLWFDEDSAVLQKGLPAGTSVVVEGAAELFGTEFGPGK